MIDDEKLNRLEKHCNIQRHKNFNESIREEHEFIYQLIYAYRELKNKLEDLTK